MTELSKIQSYRKNIMIRYVIVVLQVNSLHHQAIIEVANDLRIVAKSSDGIVEAVEYSHPTTFMVGVQWHP
jgi:gamma-glutamyl-gamma-aminobutyrate hydrolase PuuD